MAIYKRDSDLVKSSDSAFDKEYKPGESPDHSGIYRCKGCAREVVGEEARKLPPQNHHEHSTSQGDIRWRLTVYADHRAK